MTIDHVVEVDLNIEKNKKNQHLSVQRTMDLSNMAFIPDSVHRAKNVAIGEFLKKY